jgi:hypothetical protein
LAQIKREKAETTTLSYLDQTWTTKMFAHGEIPSERLTQRFQIWVRRYTGVRKELQVFDRWTQTNLEIADVSGVTCVLIPSDLEFDLPKKVQFGDDGKLLSKCRLIRKRKFKFWNPNRLPGTRGLRWWVQKCLIPSRVEGKRRIWRFATVPEATAMKFRSSSRSAYGLVFSRRHRGEHSRKDLQIQWNLEMEHFRRHAQPMQDWAQMMEIRSKQSEKTSNEATKWEESNRCPDQQVRPGFSAPPFDSH